MAEQRGEVLWFSKGRGFGLIRTGEGADYYVIFEDIAEQPRELEPGEQVRFEPAARGTARIARAVRREKS